MPAEDCIAGGKRRACSSTRSGSHPAAADAAVVEGCSQPTQIPDAGRAEQLDEREDVGREGLRIGRLDSPAESGSLARVPRIAESRALSLARRKR
jgi:hypothetical protein